MAVKIKLQRMGKIRNAEYRIIVADARTRRSGKAIENIRIYQPKQEPSLIQIDSERAQYWLGIGAQPSDQVRNLLVLTGDIAKFNGKKDAVSRVKVAESDKAGAAAEAVKAAEAEAEKSKAAQAAAKAEAEAEAKAAAEASEAEAKAAEAEAEEAPAEAGEEA